MNNILGHGLKHEQVRWSNMRVFLEYPVVMAGMYLKQQPDLPGTIRHK